MSGQASTRFATRDPDEAHQFLRGAYVDSTMQISGRADGFRMVHTDRSAGPVSLTAMGHTMAVEHVVQPLGHVMVGHVVMGNVERMTAGGDEQRAGVDDVFLVAPPDQPFTIRWEALGVQVFAVDEELLADVAAGAGCSRGSLRFTDFREPDPVPAARLRRTMAYVGAELRSDDPVSPIAADALARLVAAHILTTFPNTTAAAGVVPTDRAVTNPATVRRAVAHIEVYAHEPIGLSEIAAAAHVSPRTLQMAFRHQLATTPMAYLRTVRLHGVHRELTAADPVAGATVTDIALHWGFAHPGRFAALYRQTFGRSPSTALNN